MQELHLSGSSQSPENDSSLTKLWGLWESVWLRYATVTNSQNLSGLLQQRFISHSH